MGFTKNLAIIRPASLTVVRASLLLFDNLSQAGGTHWDREPWAGKFCADNGWSHFGIFAQGPTWFRDQSLIDWLKQQRDAGFFKKFDRVAFSPQTILDTNLVPWEKRFKKGQRQDWSLAYSDAADQTAKASQVFVVYDPFMEPDAKHVDRLYGDNITPLRAFGFGHKSALVMHRMEKLKPVMQQAINGTLTPNSFYPMIRSRKDIYLYRANMESHLQSRNRPELINTLRSAFKRRRKLRKAG